MDRDRYIQQAFDEHLGDANVYKPLTERDANNIQQKLKYQVNSFISTHVNSEAETIYLRRAMKKFPAKHSRFYMTLKAHKQPIKMRPIVSNSGTFMSALSKWLDYWLQQLKPFVPTYIKDSFDLQQKLTDLGPLPPNALIFIADAVSMYTNINTDHGLQVISWWLDELEPQLPNNFPIKGVKVALKLVMENNVFEFGDKWFLQLLGTAMGTPAAVMYATLYYAWWEKTTLIPKYQQQLKLLRRFIDDMFGIWLWDPNNLPVWEEFKRDLNSFGILRWEVKEPGKRVDYLDLTIEIVGDKIVTRTYQKELNLYLYIPPHSAHPIENIRGAVHGLMRRYKQQNTEESDYIKMVILLFRRLAARGWDRMQLKQLLLEVHNNIKNNKKRPRSDDPPIDSHERLILHFEYHPCDIPRKKIRHIYKKHCAKLEEDSNLGIQQMIVAYSRPTNLRDAITRAKLHQAPGREASTFGGGR